MREGGRVNARRYMHRLNERITHIKIVRQGWLAGTVSKQSGEDAIAAILIPGDMVGSGVLLRGRPFFAMQALSDVDYCAFPLSAFVQLAESDPHLSQAVNLYIAQVLEANHNTIYDIGIREADERIISLLLGLYDRAAERGLAQDGTMAFPLRQHHLAKATGMTQVHISRVLKRLRDEGILKLDHQMLTIVDMDRARSLVG